MKKVRNHILTDKQIDEMRNKAFNKKGVKQEPFIRLPNSFVNYIVEADKSPNWKGQVILTYIGVVISYIEAHNTYRKYHMSLENIMDFIGVNSNNEEVIKAFTKNSWLSKNDYINRTNEMPYKYTVKNNKMVFETTANLSKKEINETFNNMSNRQVRGIEPVRHTKGLRRVRGRGYQILEAPLLSEEANDYITIKYSTIIDFIHKKISPTDFYVLCCLKEKTKNGYLTRIKPYTTSYRIIGSMTGLSENTILKSMKLLTQVYEEGIKYKTVTKNINGKCVSSSELKLIEYAI